MTTMATTAVTTTAIVITSYSIHYTKLYELELVKPEVIIPIGRLAITLFFDKKQKLDEIIGREKQIESGAWVIPLPHSSGASRWHQSEANRALIEEAIELIAKHYQRLFG